jgi:hypothetical protein
MAKTKLFPGFAAITTTEFFYIGCSFKFIVRVGVERSIVNAPRITDHATLVTKKIINGLHIILFLRNVKLPT